MSSSALTWKEETYSILMDDASKGPIKKAVNLFLVALILLNIGAVVIETVESISNNYKFYFNLFEIFSVLIFTIEYLARFWVCNIDKQFKDPALGRVQYVLTPLAIVDLLAILPFFLSWIFPLDLRILRVLRLFRLIRLLKLAKYSESVKMFGDILKNKKEDLIISILIVTILLLLASSTLYLIEREAQPKNFSSIPATMWWGVATLTTVGYGDVYPITPLGKFIGAIVAILGVGIFALPAGLLASGFSEYLGRKESEIKYCPSCGKEIKN